MPKNVLFSLKICKNLQTLRSVPQTSTSDILHCEFFFLHLPTKHRFFRNQPKYLIYL